jgi:hypothetical protein
MRLDPAIGATDSVNIHSSSALEPFAVRLSIFFFAECSETAGIFLAIRHYR